MPGKHNAGCNCCSGPCEYCRGGVPAELEVEENGWTAGDTCDDATCADLDGTYAILNTGGSASFCMWEGTYSPPGYCQVGHTIRAEMLMSGSNYVLRVTRYVLIGGLNFTCVTWEHDFGTTRPNCNSFSNVACTKVSQASAPEGCDSCTAPETVYVTAA